MDTKQLGEVVARRRRELKLSQEDLANRADISRAYVSLIERGEAANLSTGVLEKLGVVLGIPVSKLLGRPEQSDLLIPPALREFAMQEGLDLEVVEKMARIPRRGKEPQTAQQWKELYKVIKPYLK